MLPVAVLQVHNVYFAGVYKTARKTFQYLKQIHLADICRCLWKKMSATQYGL